MKHVTETIQSVCQWLECMFKHSELLKLLGMVYEQVHLLEDTKTVRVTCFSIK